MLAAVAPFAYATALQVDVCLASTRTVAVEPAVVQAPNEVDAQVAGEVVVTVLAAIVAPATSTSAFALLVATAVDAQSPQMRVAAIAATPQASNAVAAMTTVLSAAVNATPANSQTVLWAAAVA
eukprot:5626648-Amphidinium_carterae.1